MLQNLEHAKMHRNDVLSCFMNVRSYACNLTKYHFPILHHERLQSADSGIKHKLPLDFSVYFYKPRQIKPGISNSLYYLCLYFLCNSCN